MSPEKSFSDREVALVLRRAAELESVEGGSAGGASRQDIMAIASEAGISPESVERAMIELAAESTVTGSAFFPPSSRRAARIVPEPLDRERLAVLARVIEDRVGRPGTITEALGTVRWTSNSGIHGMWTTQVTLSPEPDGTRIGVHQNMQGAAAFYGLPAAWGGMIGFTIAMSAGLATAPVLGIVAAGMVGGALIGRTILDVISRRSRDRVERVAGDLAEDASRLGPAS